MEFEFFKFIYKRQLIWYKRFVLRQPQPWTEDPVLATYKIINVYRELDKCTIYLVDKLKGEQDRRRLLLNIIFYRFFNRINLYEEIGVEPFTSLTADIKRKIAQSFERNKSEGKPIFNNAYLISSGTHGKKKHLSILDNLTALDIDALVDEIDATDSPQAALDAITSVPMVGPFLACEIWTDLSYFKFFKQGWNDNDFVNIGPGAKWGIDILYGSKISKDEQKSKLKHLRDAQSSFLDSMHTKLGTELPWSKIAFKQAYSNYPYLSITNIEGSLCEFRKYWNISHGKGRRKYFLPQQTNPKPY